MPVSTFNLDSALTTVRRFITGKLLESGLAGYVIGLSGGLDSSVVAAIAVSAVGKERVFGLLLPYRHSSESSRSDALAVSQSLDIQCRTVDISPMIDAYFGGPGPHDRVRMGNKMARERMSILFDVAQETGRLVLGTSNRTEFCLGYTTWFGDSAASINPIAELYKSEVRELAVRLEVPQSIIAKSPSADLWPDQTDEEEIGVTYDIIDKLLVRMIDDGVTSMSALEAEGFSTLDISKLMSLVNRNAFKRKMPAVASLGRGPVPDHLQAQP